MRSRRLTDCLLQLEDRMQKARTMFAVAALFKCAQRNGALCSVYRSEGKCITPTEPRQRTPSATHAHVGDRSARSVRDLSSVRNVEVPRTRPCRSHNLRDMSLGRTDERVCRASRSSTFSHPYFFFCAFNLAQRARWADAIRARAAALIVRGPRRRPVAPCLPVPFNNALARCSFSIWSSRDWITCWMLMAGQYNNPASYFSRCDSRIASKSGRTVPEDSLSGRARRLPHFGQRLGGSGISRNLLTAI